MQQKVKWKWDLPGWSHLDKCPDGFNYLWKKESRNTIMGWVCGLVFPVAAVENKGTRVFDTLMHNWSSGLSQRPCWRVFEAVRYCFLFSFLGHPLLPYFRISRANFNLWTTCSDLYEKNNNMFLSHLLLLSVVWRDVTVEKHDSCGSDSSVGVCSKLFVTVTFRWDQWPFPFLRQLFEVSWFSAVFKESECVTLSNTSSFAPVTFIFTVASFYCCLIRVRHQYATRTTVFCSRTVPLKKKKKKQILIFDNNGFPVAHRSPSFNAFYWICKV